MASIAAAERAALEATEKAKAWQAKLVEAKRAAAKKAAAEKAAAEAATWEAERQTEAQAANAQADGGDSPDGEPDELRAALNEIAPKRKNWGGVASAMREHFQEDFDGAGFALFEAWTKRTPEDDEALAIHANARECWDQALDFNIASNNNKSISREALINKLRVLVKTLGSSRAGTVRTLAMAASLIEEERIEWVVPDLIPAGDVTLVVGQSKIGKSQFGIYALARVSTGEPFVPGQHTGFLSNPASSPRPPAHGALITAEDNIEKVVIARLKVAGGDLNRIKIVRGYEEIDEAGVATQKRFTFERTIEALSDLMRRWPGIKLIVIDPVNAHIGTKIDPHKNADVRRVMVPMVEFAQKHGIAIVLIHHMKKGQKHGNVTDMAGGSNAWVEASRAVFTMAEEPGSTGRVILELTRTNYSKGKHAYLCQIEDASTAINPNTSKLTILDERPTMSVSQALGDKEPSGGQTVVEEAKDFLISFLGDRKGGIRLKGQNGWVLQKDIMAAAKKDGHDADAVYRAKRELKVQNTRDKFGPGGEAYWRLPSENEAEPAAKGGSPPGREAGAAAL